ncbi:MAG: RCC1 domain-containing protein [Kofleriaceae bacterium]
MSTRAARSLVLENASSVGTGYLYTCATTLDGRLWCWGYGQGGRLGRVTDINDPVPTEVPSEESWSHVVVGTSHACALTATSSVSCWGNNRSREVANTAEDEYTSPTRVFDQAEWSSIGLGDYHSCGLRSDGVLVCWGNNASGQLGVMNAVGSAEVPSGDQPWTRVVAGGTNTCALRGESLWCWGSNATLQLGASADETQRTPIEVFDRGWRDVTLGDNHLCGTTTGGVTKCVGARGSGQVGDGSGGSRRNPVRLDDLVWEAIDVGSKTSCGRTENGFTFCWGANSLYEGGDGTTSPRQRPTFALIGSIGGTLGVGTNHACGSAENGTFCWGDNRLLQADPDQPPGVLRTPTQTSLPSELALGEFHTCALANQTLSCFGLNDQGQLGRPTPEPSNQPNGSEVVPGLWQRAAAGRYHTCAISALKTLRCWGNNGQGQLGATDGNLAGNKWARLAAGTLHTCAIDDDQQLFCWGANDRGQIGDASTMDRFVPRPIPGIWLDVAAGGEHTCAIDDQRRLWCWGDNRRGQVGGDALVLEVPTMISSVVDIIDVAAGGDTTCIRQTTGELWCWGTNTDGQVGDGSAWTGELSEEITIR